MAVVVVSRGGCGAGGCGMKKKAIAAVKKKMIMMDADGSTVRACDDRHDDIMLVMKSGADSDSAGAARSAGCDHAVMQVVVTMLSHVTLQHESS